MAQATFSDIQYQLMRVYRNRNYIANLAMKGDAFFSQLKKRAKKTGGQADMVPVSYDGSGVPSNVEGITGTSTPSKGVQFAVTPVPMTNLAAISALGAAAGVSDVGAIVKSLKREIDQAIQKVGKVASIELWSDGWPAVGVVENVAASTTLDFVDSDDIVKISVGDRLVAAQTRTSGALRATVLTVVKVNQNSGTAIVDQNVNTSWVNGDSVFIENTRITSAAKVAITGVTGWLPAVGGTLFGVDTTVDDRLIGMRVSAPASDIEGAFIDGVKTMVTYSSNGTEGVQAFMHPATWAILAKAMQSRTLVLQNPISPMKKKGREGDISFSGWNVATPNGTIEVFAPQFCPKNVIFMLNMDTWELVGWGVDFPSLVANQLGAGPPIFMDPATGNISAMVGGFPQLECNAPGWNLTITLT